MSGQYIPKEQLTAYERWELAAFDEAERMSRTMREAEAAAQARRAERPGAPAEETPAADEPLTPAPSITPEELAALREQAAQEGREAGFAEGLRKGYEEGRAQGEQAILAEAGKLATLANAFSNALRETESVLADEVLQLSLDLSRQMLCSALKAKPERVLPVVREAMAALISQHGHPTLILNPDDAALVRPQIEDQIAHTGWRIMEDPTTARGGCRVENAGAEVDATLAERWRRVLAALGQDGEWIDPT